MITRQDFKEWLVHPITKLVMDEISIRISENSNRIFSIDNQYQLSRILGAVKAYKDIYELHWADIKPETKEDENDGFI